MANRELAKEILERIGGRENIDTITHCTTRLRFRLIDADKADTVSLRETRGVLGVLMSRGYYMVVIGKGVDKVYDDIKKLTAPCVDKSNGEADAKKGRGAVSFFIYTALLAGIAYTAAELTDIFGFMNVNGNIRRVLSVVADFGLYLIPVIFLICYDKKSDEGKKSDIRIINSPVKGQVVKLSDVGVNKEEGVGIIPESNLIVSPVDGEITDVSHCGNSVTVISDDGVEIFINIGRDTEEVKRGFFKLFVKCGDRVRMGDPIVEMEKNSMEIEGIDVVTLVLIANSENYSRVKAVAGVVHEQKPLIEIWE